MAQMNEQIKAPEKELNKMGISNLSNVGFKTLVIRMLIELIEDLDSIKKVQLEMKDTVIEIRTIYKESTVEQTKPRIKSMIWNIRKQKNNQSEQQEEKRI